MKKSHLSETTGVLALDNCVVHELRCQRPQLQWQPLLLSKSLLDFTRQVGVHLASSEHNRHMCSGLSHGDSHCLLERGPKSYHSQGHLDNYTAPGWFSGCSWFKGREYHSLTRSLEAERSGATLGFSLFHNCHSSRTY